MQNDHKKHKKQSHILAKQPKEGKITTTVATKSRI